MSLRPTIEEIRALGHHQSLYDWGIQFFNLPSLLTGFTSADLNTRCQTATLPRKSFENIPVNLRGHRVFQHGTINYGNELNLRKFCTYWRFRFRFSSAFI